MQLNSCRWKAIDFATLNRCSISYFDSDKSEPAVSKWARARTMAAKVLTYPFSYWNKKLQTFLYFLALWLKFPRLEYCLFDIIHNNSYTLLSHIFFIASTIIKLNLANIHIPLWLSRLDLWLWLIIILGETNSKFSISSYEDRISLWMSMNLALMFFRLVGGKRLV